MFATLVFVWRMRRRRLTIDNQLGLRTALVVLLANVFVGVMVSEVLDVWLRECLLVGGSSGMASALLAWFGLRPQER